MDISPDRCIGNLQSHRPKFPRFLWIEIQIEMFQNEIMPFFRGTDLDLYRITEVAPGKSEKGNPFGRMRDFGFQRCFVWA